MFYVFEMDDHCQNIQLRYAIENYTSVVWNEQYLGFDEFSIVCPYDKNLVQNVKTNYIIAKADEISPDLNTHRGYAEHVMIIEAITIDDSEEGTTVTLEGHGAKVLLNRRVVKQQDLLKGTLVNVLGRPNVSGYTCGIIVDAIGSATQTGRGSDQTRRWVYALSNIDQASSAIEVETEAFGKKVGDFVNEVLSTTDSGWAVGMQATHSSGQMTYQLYINVYQGADRSRSVVSGSHVLFSRDNGMLLKSHYRYTIADKMTLAVVQGEEWADKRDMATYDMDANAAGVNLWEGFIDMSSEQMAPAIGIQGNGYTEYTDFLVAKGKEYIDKQEDQSFEFSCEVAVDGFYKLGVDYFLGDKVEVETIDGTVASARITEIITSEDRDGVKISPTFGAWKIN